MGYSEAASNQSGEKKILDVSRRTMPHLLRLRSGISLPNPGRNVLLSLKLCTLTAGLFIFTLLVDVTKNF